MASIVWSNTTPGTDMTASAVDNQIRSDRTAIAAGIGTALYWPSDSAISRGDSATSSGQMLPGTARSLYSAAATDLVGGAGNGALGLFGTHDYLKHVGSAATVFFGGALMEEHATHPTPGARWVVARGSSVVSIDNTPSTISFGITYDVAPYVWQTVEAGDAGNDLHFHGVNTVSTTAFESRNSYVGGGIYIDDNVTMHWCSEGTVSF